jgi:alpha-amylase
MRKPNLKCGITHWLCAFMPVIQLMTYKDQQGTKALSSIDVTHHDGHPFSTGKSMTTTTTGKYVANPGGGVMMQAFTGMYLLAETGGIQ